MATKRIISADKTTVQLEFTNGEIFDPIELNRTTDELTRMIGVLEGRLARLEAKAITTS
jgi:hypothetical protein